VSWQYVARTVTATCGRQFGACPVRHQYQPLITFTIGHGRPASASIVPIAPIEGIAGCGGSQPPLFAFFRARISTGIRLAGPQAGDLLLRVTGAGGPGMCVLLVTIAQAVALARISRQGRAGSAAMADSRVKVGRPRRSPSIGEVVAAPPRTACSGLPAGVSALARAVSVEATLAPSVR
jgi:hypothetical protein